MMNESALGSKTLVDLALLGLLSDQRQPLPVLISLVKRAGGDRFTPTAMFIEERLLALITHGSVEVSSTDDQLCVTSAGLAQITRLLRLELDPTAANLRSFCATLKLCLLDLVDSNTRDEIVHMICTSRRCCPAQGDASDLPTCPMMTRYLVIEGKRQAHEEHWFDEINLEEGILDPVT